MPFLPILAFFLGDHQTLLSAAKADDLKEKYPDLAAEIDRLADSDPTPQKKYLQWSVGQLQSGASVDEVIEAVKQYDKVLPRLTGKDKDIGSLKTVADMQAVVDKATQVSTKGDVKKKARKGGVILHEDDRWMLVRPDTQEASIYYGSNTAWCVARRELDKNYWYRYFADRNVRFYFLIDKQATPRGVGEYSRYHFSKLAMMIHRGKPLSDEPFQDASNHNPHATAVEDAIGPVFNTMHDLALADAKKLPINTWAFTLLYEDIDPDTFISIYKEHLPEINSEGFKPYMKKLMESTVAGAGRGNTEVDEMFVDLCEDISSNLSGSNSTIAENILNTVIPGHDGYKLPNDLIERVLTIFSKSKSVLIRSWVANSRLLTFDIQEALMNDSEAAVQRVILNNPILMWDPETKKNAFDKAYDPNTNVDAWLGLVLNEELPVEMFEKLVRDRKGLSVHEMDEVINGVIKSVEDTRMMLELSKDDEVKKEFKKEIDIADKKMLILLRNRWGLRELTAESAMAVAKHGSASALRELFYKVSDKKSPLNKQKNVDREGLLETIALNTNISNYLVDSILILDLEDLLEEPKYSRTDATRPLLLSLASNDGLSTEQINFIINRTVDLFLDEEIPVFSKHNLSYKLVIGALSRNKRISKENSKFLKKLIEEKSAYFAEGDLLPNSDFMEASSPVLSLFDEDQLVSDLMGFIRYEVKNGGRPVEDVVRQVRTMPPFSKAPALVDRTIRYMFPQLA